MNELTSIQLYTKGLWVNIDFVNVTYELRTHLRPKAEEFCRVEATDHT